MGMLCLSSLNCQDEEVDEAFGLRVGEFLAQSLILQCPDHVRSLHPRRVCHCVVEGLYVPFDAQMTTNS